MQKDRTAAVSMAPRPVDNVHPVGANAVTQSDEALRRVVADQIGDRKPGAVYYDGPRLVQVREVITDCREARRILKRRAAQFAIHVTDLHAGTDYFTCTVWTGTDRVLKAVAA